MEYLASDQEGAAEGDRDVAGVMLFNDLGDADVAVLQGGYFPKIFDASLARALF